MIWAVMIAIVAVLVVTQVIEYRRSPLCKWCTGRHYGRCVWNPRSGRIFANVNDGHFDYEDPNQ